MPRIWLSWNHRLRPRRLNGSWAATTASWRAVVICGICRVISSVSILKTALRRCIRICLTSASLLKSCSTSLSVQRTSIWQLTRTVKGRLFPGIWHICWKSTHIHRAASCSTKSRKRLSSQGLNRLSRLICRRSMPSRPAAFWTVL